MRRRTIQWLMIPWLAVTMGWVSWLVIVGGHAGWLIEAFGLVGFLVGLLSFAWGLAGQARLVVAGIVCVVAAIIVVRWTSSASPLPLFVTLALMAVSAVVCLTYQQRPSQESAAAVRNRLRRAMRRLAETHAGRYLPEYPRVVFSQDGITEIVCLRRYSASQQRAYVEFVFPWDDAQFRLELFPAGWFTRWKEWMGMRDVRLGESAFDARFFVTCHDPRAAAELIDAGTQSQLMRLHDEQSMFSLTISGGKWILMIGIPAVSLDRLDRYSQLARQLYRGLARWTADAIVWVDRVDLAFVERVEVEITCQVCGESIEGPAACCQQCATPHHHDCWEYLGGCSTYACNGRRFHRVPSPSGT